MVERTEDHHGKRESKHLIDSKDPVRWIHDMDPNHPFGAANDGSFSRGSPPTIKQRVVLEMGRMDALQRCSGFQMEIFQSQLESISC